MLHLHHTVSLVGPFRDHAAAMRGIVQDMAVDHRHPVEADSTHACTVTVLRVGKACWMDLGSADRVIARLLRREPAIRAYRCSLELGTGMDDREDYPFELELSRLVSDPEGSELRLVDLQRGEHVGRRVTRVEDAWAHAVALLAAHEPGMMDADIAPHPVAQWQFDVRSEGVRPSIVRARRALADAREHECNRIGAKWHLRLVMFDGSRRVLVLDDEDWAELDLRR